MPDSDILSGELPIKLAPGDAVLLRVQRVGEDMFTIEYKLAE